MGKDRTELRLAAAAGLGVGVRAMTDDDLPFVAALYASTREEEVGRFGWPAGQQQAFLAQQHLAQHRFFRSHYAKASWLIVELGGEAVGRLYFEERPQAIHFIDLSLLPAARGRGVGGALIADVIAFAAATGRAVTMRVERTNPALRLYHRLGFAVVDDEGANLLLELKART